MENYSPYYPNIYSVNSSVDILQPENVEERYLHRLFEHSSSQWDPNAIEISDEWFEFHRANSESSFAISCVAADPFEELLWVGYASGKVTAFVVPTFQKYSSVICSKAEVRQLVPLQEGVLVVSSDNLKVISRGGLPLLHLKSEHMRDMVGATFLNQEVKNILLVGSNAFIFVVDLSSGRLLKETKIFGGISGLKVASHDVLVCSHISGMLSFRDTRTMQMQNSIQCHTGGLTDFDVNGDLVATCGWSKSLDGGFMDPEVKIYDYRTKSWVNTIAFPMGPSFLKFHFTSSELSLFICSQNGYFQFRKTSDQQENNVYQKVEPGDAALTAFDISSNGACILFADQIGMMYQLVCAEDDTKLNDNSKPTEIVEYFPPPPRFQADIQEYYKPLSSIQIPYWILEDSSQSSHLFSSWNSSFGTGAPRHEPPLLIDPSLFPNYRQVDFVAHASNPGLPRNRTSYHGTTKSATKYVHEYIQSKTKKIRPWRAYRHIEIKPHLKLGIDGFDFKPYNTTIFNGLENDLPNSYCNAGLQCLYFIEALMTEMINHLCKKEFCLSCEMGFLFHMLGQPGAVNCQASNFLRAFRQIPQASGLGLTETPADDDISLLRIMESFNRFILEQLHKECSTSTEDYSIIEILFGSKAKSHAKCLSCKYETKREYKAFQYDMMYPERNTSDYLSHTFAKILTQSLCRVTHTKAWCDKCQRYQLTEQRREMESLPNILCINTAASKADVDFWKSRSEKKENKPWLPMFVRIRITSNGTIHVEDADQSSLSVSDSDAVYELKSTIAHIFDPSKKASKHSHLVAQVHVSPSYFEKMEQGNKNNSDGRWYLFNDFHVQPIEQREVQDLTFKSPCVLYYQRVDVVHRVQKRPYQNPITEGVYFNDVVVTKSSKTYPVTPETLPGKGDIVAIDAEFVSLGAEETEIRSDGTKTVVNPIHFSLARVTLCWGQPGTLLYGQPFMDDYIQTSETVVDYLSRYSGIFPGDLDPKISKFPVTSLKSAYVKLRCLVDRGCIFVGHGLAKDFRIINSFVPANQIIDTVEIYHLEGQRKISLKFLSTCLLKTDIQQETHCSIEDARTALFLYHKYLDLKKKGKFESILVKIYEIGRITKWTATPLILSTPEFALDDK